MLFPTVDFAIFFAVVFLGHWLLQPFPTRWKLFMIGASYLFYAWWDWKFTALLAASTVVAQASGLLVSMYQDDRKRRWAMAFGVCADLSLLVWFKYYGFLSFNAANAFHAMGVTSPVPLLQITLPIGISFYTFMGISYIVDVYRGRLELASWLDFFTYLSFFPHLVAGPIVRGTELLPQIRTRRDPRRLDWSRAAWLIWGGLFKKIVIASFLATSIVDPVFGDPRGHTSLEILVAVYAYAVQIYADFSGYTDIAIGVAALLGFRFPENFDRPYSARSIQDFWRRWHMTLSRWLRDYLYIPLGGNRVSEPRLYANLMITMLLAGLWHGAAWTFVAWGGIHGGVLCLEHRRTKTRAAAGLPAAAGVAAAPNGDRRVAWERLGTFHIVCLGWVFFRADSFGSAFELLWRLVTAFGRAPLVTPLVLLTVAAGIGAQYVPTGAGERLRVRLSGVQPVAAGALLGLALLVITTLGPQGVAPFIYYRF